MRAKQGRDFLQHAVFIDESPRPAPATLAPGLACRRASAKSGPSSRKRAPGLEWLVPDDAPISWATAGFDAYVSAVKTYWNDWGKAKWI
jgi:hypothetical protein